MTQSGTNNPVVFVIENTLGGEIVWSRAAAGFYVGTVTGTLLTGRCNFGNGIDGAGNYILIDPGNATKTILSTNGIIGAQFITEFAVQNFTFDELSLTDGIYAEAPIFIEIYQ
jgi:hypothetical protein